jgi:hypothetical protein
MIHRPYPTGLVERNEEILLAGASDFDMPLILITCAGFLTRSVEPFS